jgi:DeoR/GlpR family transcriptional regulator of sugar metabolism
MSDEMMPKIDDFQEDARKNDTLMMRLLELDQTVHGEPYEYFISAFIFDIAFGSVEMVKFVESLTKTKNDELLKSVMIKRYANYMWKDARPLVLA